jgi:hypothetical protein
MVGHFKLNTWVTMHFYCSLEKHYFLKEKCNKTHDLVLMYIYFQIYTHVRKHIHMYVNTYTCMSLYDGYLSVFYMSIGLFEGHCVHVLIFTKKQYKSNF